LQALEQLPARSETTAEGPAEISPVCFEVRDKLAARFLFAEGIEIGPWSRRLTKPLRSTKRCSRKLAGSAPDRKLAWKRP
jgi:hypothetical protein